MFEQQSTPMSKQLYYKQKDLRALPYTQQENLRALELKGEDEIGILRPMIYEPAGWGGNGTSRRAFMAGGLARGFTYGIYGRQFGITKAASGEQMGGNNGNDKSDHGEELLGNLKLLLAIPNFTCRLLNYH